MTKGGNKMSITHSGNIDDIRCSINNLIPKNDVQKDEFIDYLKKSYETEANRDFPRSTVLKMINVKIRKLERF